MPLHTPILKIKKESKQCIIQAGDNVGMTGGPIVNVGSIGSKVVRVVGVKVGVGKVGVAVIVGLMGGTFTHPMAAISAATQMSVWRADRTMLGFSYASSHQSSIQVACKRRMSE